MTAIRYGPDARVRLSLHVQPGAARTEWVGLHGEAIKLRLAAAPVDGKANACLLAFVAEYFLVNKGSVRLLAGETARQKVVQIDAPDIARMQALRALLGLPD